MDTKLKPCPFCGGEAELIDRRKLCVVTFDAYTLPWSVSCVNSNKCSVLMPFTRPYATKEEAIEVWNKRAELTCTFSEALGAVDRPTCSVCGYRADAYDCDMWVENGETHWEYTRNYCDGCGTKVVKIDGVE